MYSYVFNNNVLFERKLVNVNNIVFQIHGIFLTQYNSDTPKLISNSKNNYLTQKAYLSKLFHYF